MAPGPSEPSAEKSYLSSAVDSINPWAGSRSTTPTPREASMRPNPSNPGDHSVNHLYGQSFKRYPSDCPPLLVRWFHAVDIPKRKPQLLNSKPPDDAKKSAPQPKKLVAFSLSDSRAIEAAYQTKLEILEEAREKDSAKTATISRTSAKRPRIVSAEEAAKTNLNRDAVARATTKVAVNEDFLFDVDIEERELAPVYWLGPIYEVRRGSWFYQEGSTLRPCEENLAAQLEEGYLKTKPWRNPVTIRRSSGKLTPKSSVENLKAAATSQLPRLSKGSASLASGDAGTKQAFSEAAQHQPQTYRLFGTYMNHLVTYQDATTAYLTSEGVLSWVTSTVYERLGGGGYMSGAKLVRGYTEPKRSKDGKRAASPAETKMQTEERDAAQEQRRLKRRSHPSSTRVETTDAVGGNENQLTHQLSSLIANEESSDLEEEEAIRRTEEQDMEEDYNATAGETQGREIEHLVLVTHGIGQLLGFRMQSVNFVHDVNILRKTLKSVYATSDDLRALNGEAGHDGPGNCRIQVLPVLWRHLLDFPRRKQKKREHDVSEAWEDEDEYPALDDITVEGVAFARSLISDLALDVLLYQSAYRERIAEIVLQESNRIFKLFKERNPGFTGNGKVHVVGHSLGSAIMFDILCRQKENLQSPDPVRAPPRLRPSQDRSEPGDPKDLAFYFEVQDFYCLGSPIGLFQMLKGRTISARHPPSASPSQSRAPNLATDEMFPAASLNSPMCASDSRLSAVTGLACNVSSPKISQMFNIFHPSDPISYRVEPLISPAMSALKPQALPYTKKGIFGAVAPQGLSGIGARVGQSVSGLWSSLSAGISNSLLNRSLGLTQEDVDNITASRQSQHVSSPGAGTNILGGGVISPDSEVPVADRSEKTDERKRQLASAASLLDGRATESGNEATLIDDELETLYSQFQKKRIDLAKEKGGESLDTLNWSDEDRKAQKMKREELKVRALNRNGRVDYSIQESVLDFNPMSTIASHMSYWGDEDVSHFIMSQLLSSKTQTPRS